MMPPPTSGVGISIHPPHAGRDVWERTRHINVTNFNPPSPCGEGPPERLGANWAAGISIHPPHAGRDKSSAQPYYIQKDFNPPSPCGEGRWTESGHRALSYFNPPSPCGEGLFPGSIIVSNRLFQSTLPMRGGTAIATIPNKH